MTTTKKKRSELSEEDKTRISQKLSIVTLLTEIRNEIKGLRKDLKQQTKRPFILNPENTDMKQYIEQYVKTIRDVVPSIIPNLSSSSVSCGTNDIPDPSELKKHLAGYVKEMTKSEVLEHMPENLKGAYMRLIQSFIKPNDPIFSEPEKVDPREPVNAGAGMTGDELSKDYDLDEKYKQPFICDDCKEPIPKGEYILTDDIEYLHEKCAKARADALDALKKKK